MMPHAPSYTISDYLQQTAIGFISGCLIAARWGYYRACQSNARLATATTHTS
ncbi:MAG TPA: hypothetical protein VIY52_08465 [Streptosporangiaceae bacterium]